MNFPYKLISGGPVHPCYDSVEALNLVTLGPLVLPLDLLKDYLLEHWNKNKIKNKK